MTLIRIREKPQLCSHYEKTAVRARLNRSEHWQGVYKSPRSPGCGIAASAALAGVNYAEAKKKANKLGIYAVDTAL